MIEQERFSAYPYYFWLIALIAALYIIWVLFVRTFTKICRHYCANAVEKYQTYNENFNEDFYECIKYPALRHELYSSTSNLRNARRMHD